MRVLGRKSLPDGFRTLNPHDDGRVTDADPLIAPVPRLPPARRQPRRQAAIEPALGAVRMDDIRGLLCEGPPESQHCADDNLAI